MESCDRVDDLFRQLEAVAPQLTHGFEGCSRADLERLEAAWDQPLPASFRALLLRVGRSWGALMKGEDISAQDMPDYRRIAESLLPSDSSLELRRSDLVFLTHQGYQFLFLRGDGSGDPPVWHYDSDEQSFQRVSPRFTKWLEDVLREEIELRRDSITGRPSDA